MTTAATPISFSGSIPDYYDSFLGPVFFEPYAKDMAQRIKKMQPKNVLELAAGTGRLTKMLPDVLAQDAVITATDINPAMVNLGKEKAKGTNILWQVADAISIPFESETFDCVVVQFGVMFYSDRIKAFKEAFRVLKTGGVFLFNAWDRLEENQPSYLAQKTLEHFFPQDTPAFFSVPYSYYDDKKMRSDLEEAGFNNVEVELVKLTGHSASPKDTAKGLLQGTPASIAIEERSPGKLNLIVEHLAKEIEKEYGPKSFDASLQAWVVMAGK